MVYVTDIGKPKRIIEIMPLPEEVPTEAPVEPVQAPEPEEAPKEVPA